LESGARAQPYRGLWKLCKFISVGVCATAIQYVLLGYLVEVFSLQASVASTIGFALAAAVNYLLNRRFTFQSDARHVIAAPKFIFVAWVGMTANFAIISWLEAHTAVHYLVSQACATSIVMLWNFTVSAVWTFRRNPKT